MSFRIIVEMEDNIMIATDTQPPLKPGALVQGCGLCWDILLIDMFSGKTHKTIASLAQLTAILALGVGSVSEENTPGYHVSVLYETARECLKDCPNECSPIP